MDLLRPATPFASDGNRMKLLLKILLIQALLLGAVLGEAAADHADREYRIKAALMYNFAKYVAWPAGMPGGDTGSIKLCIKGEDPFGAAFDPIREKKVRGRSLEIALCGEGEPDPGAEPPHMLFVAGSEKETVEALLDLCRGYPILTVSDMEGFAEKGGMIEMVRKNNSIKFKVNLGAVEEAGISISSRLLKLATIVE